MARSRNIKPGFFCNEVLAEMDFATRLLFIGLWTEADRDGKLEDRPKKIKMAIFPDDSVDVDSMLNVLHAGDLITRYSVGALKVIKINAWAKHQSPHHTEKKSILPDNHESQVNNAPLTVKKQEHDGGNPPDSLNLIPDTLDPDSLNQKHVDSKEPTAANNDFISEQFERFWRNYPLKKSKVATARAFKSLVKGKKESQVRFYVDMILNYHIDCVEREKAGSVEDKGSSALHASTLINQQRWKDDPEYFAKFKTDWIKENGQD